MVGEKCKYDFFWQHTMRVVIDGRCIKTRTILIKYPVPTIEEEDRPTEEN